MVVKVKMRLNGRMALDAKQAAQIRANVSRERMSRGITQEGLAEKVELNCQRRAENGVKPPV